MLFDKASVMETQKEKALGVEGDIVETGGKISEADRLVNATKQKIADGETPAVGVSASNSGRGHDLVLRSPSPGLTRPPPGAGPAAGPAPVRTGRSARTGTPRRARSRPPASRCRPARCGSGRW